MTEPWWLAIDYGTSSTAAASWQGEMGARVVELSSGRRLSSAVAVRDGAIVVGEAAERQLVLTPDAAVRTPKRSLGLRDHLLIGGRPVETVEAVGEVLREVVRQAVSEQPGPAPKRVCLTHPARWGSERLDALREAASRAGIAEPLLVPEPIGAAIYYGRSLVDVGDYLGVYDLGGGTFDTAVLRRTEEGYELVGPPGGDEAIGGEDFDHRLFDHVVERVNEAEPAVGEALRTSDEPTWRQAATNLLVEVRRAKEALSRQTTYTMVLPPPLSRDFRVTRPEFEQLIHGDVQATVEEFRNTVIAAGLQPADLAARCLTGGSSRVPLVSRLLHDAFEGAPTTYEDPKAVVSLGAADAVHEAHAEAALERTTTILEPEPEPEPEPVTEAAEEPEPDLPPPPDRVEPSAPAAPPPAVDPGPRPPDRRKALLFGGLAVFAVALLAIAAVSLLRGGSDANAPDITTIELPGNPESIAVGAGAVWVVSADDDVVWRVDPRSKEVAPVEVGVRPTAVAVGEGSVWVVNFGDSENDGSLSKVDPSSLEVDQVRVARDPTAIDVGEGWVWVAHSSDGVVSRVEPETEERRTEKVGGLPTALATGDGWAWVTQGDVAVLSRLAPDLTSTEDLEVGDGATGIAVEAGSVWVTLAGGDLARLDPSSGEEFDRVSVGDEARAVAGSDQLVVVVAGGDLKQIDADSGSVLRGVSVGSQPFGVAVDGSTAWVINEGSNTLSEVRFQD